jgi:hypothetical protein
MASVAAVKPDFWADYQRLAGAKMHIFIHQDYRHFHGGSVRQLFDLFFVNGPKAENPDRFADSNRSVFCVPLGGMQK